MNRLKDKIVLITGASSGIGQACAAEYAKHGSHLILCARRTSRLIGIQDQFKIDYPDIKVHPITLDVRSRESVFEAIKSLPKEFQEIDILVNNAGLVVGVDKVEDVTPEAVDTMFDTNVKGLLHITQAILPGMKSRARGHVVNINSIAGTEAYANGGCYAATKHAVTALTKALRHELIDTPINITSIEPGLVETEFSIVR